MMVARGVMEGGSVRVDFSADAETVGKKAGDPNKGEFVFDVKRGPERDRSVKGRIAKAAV